MQIPDSHLGSSFDSTTNSLIHNATGSVTDMQTLLDDQHVTAVEFSFTSASAGTHVTDLRVEFTHCCGQYGTLPNI